jgi:hypothetical protein
VGEEPEQLAPILKFEHEALKDKKEYYYDF